MRSLLGAMEQGEQRMSELEYYCLAYGVGLLVMSILSYFETTSGNRSKE